MKMADFFGNGVSRVISPLQGAYAGIIWQRNRPPLDADLNLATQMAKDWDQAIVARGVPSGFLGNETNLLQEFVTHPNWSNWFRFGRQRSGETGNMMWAAVNGWLVPVTGTRLGTPPGNPNNSDTWNKIALDPPPTNAGDLRADFVFLEVWRARIAPAPSGVNKPAASSIYRYGNVEGGASYLADDILDASLGSESTQRVQLQYRIRVVKGLIGLASSPDGFDSTAVKAKGAFDALNPETATTYSFANMRQELNDPGLWRAGDGTQNALGSVDGYVYAIPICVVFRRNGVVWTGDSTSINLNGGLNRNPNAVDRTGVATFDSVMVLASAITSSQTTLTLTTASAIPLPASPATPVLIRVGDELMTYTSVVGTSVRGLVRGVQGSSAESHPAGRAVILPSGRPDGLFADQVTVTDILDLRHIVNPNGFNYETLLQSNLDKLLRGQLRSNWKRSNGGTQGVFIAYQDKISANPAALGVTRVDSPDGHRTCYSDAAMTETHEVIVQPRPSPVTVGSQSVSVPWALALNATTTRQVAADVWTAESSPGDGTGDRIVIPITQFKGSVPGADADQVRFLNDGVTGAVTIHIDGQETPISASRYTVTPTNPGPGDDITIQFVGVGSPFPTTKALYITVHVLYGAGRGISRRPDSMHAITLTNPSAELLLQPTTAISNNFALRTAWAPLWGKYRSAAYKNMLPVTAEAYADLGSKTVILTPFRRLPFPASISVQDGSSVNGGQGLMPTNTTSGAAKWGTTDPLGMFSGQSDPTASTANLYVTLPRHLVPGWGAYHVPILPASASNGTFDRGVNYGLLSKEGAATIVTDNDHNRNYVNYTATAPLSFGSFSTGDFSGATTVPSTYNGTFSFSGITHGGARFFTDTRGLGRQGIELPPFYGVARLFAVYEAADYKANGSAFNASTRASTGGGATNLLKQNFEGPTFWVEIDADGDSTFILNAEALDLQKSPTPIASFTAKQYVVEASVFGFDRGSFDLTKPFRLLLSRNRPLGQATSVTRSANIGAAIVGPVGVLPGPLAAGDTALVSYSRTPYQGDAWGSQTNYLDIGYIPGSLTSSNAYQVVSNALNPNGLTRPNQKPLEVLASIGFLTTLGTGRISGDLTSQTTIDFRNVGYEDPATYPPSSAVQERPRYSIGAVGVSEGEVHGEYLGCTERLPMGALRRDKDFRGGRFENVGNGGSSLMYVKDEGVGGFASSLARSKQLDQSELNLLPATVSSGQPGEMLVHVDGESNFNSTVNFRTHRGGSTFSASGPHPGGEVYANYREVRAPLNHTNIMAGRAFLVRNAPTRVGATEVSPGSELMMLVVTTSYGITNSGTDSAMVLIGTNGTGEGLSASDLYRIEGHPMQVDNVHYDIDPNAITLPIKSPAGVI